MAEKIEVTKEELEVVENILRKFIRKVRGLPEWNKKDVRQELILFWIKKKSRGLKLRKEWKGFMGYCLKGYCIDLLRKQYGTEKIDFEEERIENSAMSTDSIDDFED